MPFVALVTEKIKSFTEVSRSLAKARRSTSTDWLSAVVAVTALAKGASFTGLTVRTKVSLAVSTPSLTVKVIVEVPL